MTTTMPYYAEHYDRMTLLGRSLEIAVPFYVGADIFVTAEGAARAGALLAVDGITPLGAVRPPFDRMFVEVDTDALAAIQRAPSGTLIVHPAVLLSRFPLGKSGQLDLIRALTDYMGMPLANDAGERTQCCEVEDGGELVFVEINSYCGHARPFAVHVWCVALDARGHVGGASNPVASWTNDSTCRACGRMGQSSLRDLAWSADAMGWLGLFTCALLHCKNVTTREEHLPRQLRRERERKGLPDVVYRTLVVGPSPGQSGGKSAPKPEKTTRLHLCRGHFAEYGPDYGKGKLFGRLEGRYWVPPHVKGSADVGKVEKTYRVVAGA